MMLTMSDDDGLDDELAATAAEVRDALAGWRLDARIRDSIRARTMVMSGERSRRLRLPRRAWMPAALGGAAFAALAGTVIGIAIARERRHSAVAA